MTIGCRGTSRRARRAACHTLPDCPRRAPLLRLLAQCDVHRQAEGQQHADQDRRLPGRGVQVDRRVEALVQVCHRLALQSREDSGMRLPRHMSWSQLPGTQRAQHCYCWLRWCAAACTHLARGNVIPRVRGVEVFILADAALKERQGQLTLGRSCCSCGKRQKQAAQ